MNSLNFLAIANLSGMEMFIILGIVLLLFGAKKLPELARGLGKSMGEFKRARNEFESEISRAADDAERAEEDRRRKEADRKRELAAAATATAPSAAVPVETSHQS